eukprot:363433-Chlamydomonas_euryale.AAC.12
MLYKRHSIFQLSLAACTALTLHSFALPLAKSLVQRRVALVELCLANHEHCSTCLAALTALSSCICRLPLQPHVPASVDCPTALCYCNMHKLHGSLSIAPPCLANRVAPSSHKLLHTHCCEDVPRSACRVWDSQGCVDAAAALLSQPGSDPKAVTNRLLNMAVRERGAKDNCSVMLPPRPQRGLAPARHCDWLPGPTLWRRAAGQMWATN